MIICKMFGFITNKSNNLTEDDSSGGTEKQYALHGQF